MPSSFEVTAPPGLERQGKWSASPGNSAYGQHFCYALPECTWGEFHLSTPVGVPLQEVVRIPGLAVPVDGSLVPSDAPGFGMQIEEEWIVPWDHSSQGWATAAGDRVAVL